MQNRLFAVVIAALIAPSAALACAMPYRPEAKALEKAMVDIDAAAEPAPVPVAPPSAAQVTAPTNPAPTNAAPTAPPVAPASVIPEVTATPAS